ncbi:hypothetical protein D9M71_505120 [compost metagenome]
MDAVALVAPDNAHELLSLLRTCLRLQCASGMVNAHFDPHRIGPGCQVVDKPQRQLFSIGISRLGLAQTSTGAIKTTVAYVPACSLGQGQRNPPGAEHLLDLMAIDLLDDFLCAAYRQARKVTP